MRALSPACGGEWERGRRLRKARGPAPSLTLPRKRGRRTPNALAISRAHHYKSPRPAAPPAPGNPRMTPETHQLVESVVAAFARGEIVVVADDDDRENEGDLFVAASAC